MLRSISRHSRRLSIVSVGRSALLAALLAPAFLLARPALPALAASHTQPSTLSNTAPYALMRPSDPCNGSTLPC
jgi:hypothetical protein